MRPRLMLHVDSRGPAATSIENRIDCSEVWTCLDSVTRGDNPVTTDPNVGD